MKISVVEPLAIDLEEMNKMTRALESVGHEVTYYHDRNIDVEEIVKRSADAEIVVIGNLPFPTEVVESLPKLKLLAVAFTGLDHVAMEACHEQGVTVCNASGYSTINVAELAIGLIIDVLRNVTRLDPVTRKGGTKEGLVGFDLCGKTVGIIGLGEIGQRTARLLEAFGCRLLSLDRGKPKPEGFKVELVSMEQLLSESDIISLHCPLNETTRGLIGKEEFKRMKKSAYLINTARGPIVDEEALTDALKNEEISGAGIDVFTDEPPLIPEKYAFLELPNIVVAPHIAFATKEAFIRRADIVTSNIISWTNGIPVNVV